MLRHLIPLLALSLVTAPAFMQDDTPINKDWKVTADPGPALPKFPDKLPYRELSSIDPVKVLYPPGLTTFLMSRYQRNNNDMSDNVVVGDLTTGKPLGIIRNLAMPGRVTLCVNLIALSPDGKLLAHHDFQSKTLRLVEVKTGNVKRAIPCKDMNGIYLFPQPTTILVLCTDHKAEHAAVFNVETGKVVTQFPLPPNLEDRAGQVSLSPGGKFLALPISEETSSPNRIHFYDLTTGEQVVLLIISHRNARHPSAILAIAWSPDGKELAAVVNYPHPVNLGASQPNLTVWNVATGREVSRAPIERGNLGMLTLQGTEPLQWFPDQKAILLDQRFVINRADGKLLDRIEGEGAYNAHFATKVLDNTRLLVAAPFQKLVIKTVKR